MGGPQRSPPELTFPTQLLSHPPSPFLWLLSAPYFLLLFCQTRGIESVCVYDLDADLAPLLVPTNPTEQPDSIRRNVHHSCLNLIRPDQIRPD